MNDMPMPELVKDPEFTDLIQPRDTQYMEELEEDIFDHGCTDPVCVWNNIIIDGHLRYLIFSSAPMTGLYVPTNCEYE